MNYAFMTMKAMLVDYNQFEPSNLQPAIKSVLKCSDKKADEIARSHCNLLSLWACIMAIGAYNKTYADYFRECLDKGITEENGWLNFKKPQIMKTLDIDVRITDYDSIPHDLKAGEIFQVAINNYSHFMGSASADDGNMYLFDTNNRDYGAEILTALKVTDRISCIKKFEKVV